MDSKRYVVNITQDIIPIDENIIAIISSEGRSRIKGTNMSMHLLEVLEQFKKPTHLDKAVSRLSSKYNVETIKKLLRLLLEKKVLITEEDYLEFQQYTDDILEKILFFKSSGKPLEDIINIIKTKRIGVIGTTQLVHCLAMILIDSDFLYLYIAETDRRAGSSLQHKEVNISYIDLGIDYANLDKVISDCDFVFAVSKFDDHYLFNLINEMCFVKNKQWIRVVTNEAHAEIGPLFIRNRTCCYACLQMRRKQNMPLEEHVIYDLHTIYPDSDKKRNRVYKSNALYPVNTMAAGAACAEMMRFLTDLSCNLKNQVLVMDCVDFQTREEFIYKDYRCLVCGGRRSNG